MTANHDNTAIQANPSGTTANGLSNSSASVNPNLVCDPGGTCGTPQYFEVQKTVGGETGYARVEYVGSTASVVGCVVGVAGTAAVYSLAPEATVTALSGSVVWQLACYGGAKLADDVVGFVEHLFIVPPQIGARVSVLTRN
ncbi:MAG: hypothetical protein ACP5HZ_12090 [Ferrimicrobium sp.]